MAHWWMSDSGRFELDWSAPRAALCLGLWSVGPGLWSIHIGIGVLVTIHLRRKLRGTYRNQPIFWLLGRY